MRNRRNGMMATLILGAAMLGVPGSASAQTQCSIDYDGSGGAPTIVDFTVFVALWGAGNQNADLNGDQIVDMFDVNTFQAYFTFNPCPALADYQYDRSISTMDALFFQVLFAAGSPRADMNADAQLTAVDVLLFNSVFGTTY